MWIVACVAAAIYSQQYGIPSSIALAALPAFLLEVTFFTCLGVESLRKRVEKLPPWGVAALLTLAGIAPYCAASLALGSFRVVDLAWIGIFVFIASFWYVGFPAKPILDVLFLVLLAVVALTGILKRHYIAPHPKLPLDILGQLMWIRTGAFVLLCVRRVQGVGFGLLAGAVGVGDWGDALPDVFAGWNGDRDGDRLRAAAYAVLRVGAHAGYCCRYVLWDPLGDRAG